MDKNGISFYEKQLFRFISPSVKRAYIKLLRKRRFFFSVLYKYVSTLAVLRRHNI
jgi:CTP:phosphocholine cytidylyltransferase-like protein